MHAHLGLGLLRMNLDQSSHREAVVRALEDGIRDFDLGFLGESSPVFERARILGALIAEASISPNLVRVFVRGELGADFSSDLPELCALLPSGTELHYFLSDPEFQLGDLGGDFRELDRRIRADLTALEELCQAGALESYGVGSAGFTYPKDDPEYLSISSLVAPEGGARLSYFRMIELPLNLYESAAALFANQSLPAESAASSTAEGTALEAAQAFDLEVYSRRPLDAITETQLLRLIAYPDHHRVDLDEAVMRTLEVALKAETDLTEALASRGIPSMVPLHWAHRLRRQLTQVNDPEQWKQILHRKIEPELQAIHHFGFENATGLSEHYRDAMNALLLAVGMWFEKMAAERNERIRAKIVEAAPALRMDRSLAKTAMRIYRSLPGLNCIFVGMRSPRYVEEILSAEAPLPADEALRALEAAQLAIHDFLVASQSKPKDLHDHSRSLSDPRPV